VGTGRGAPGIGGSRRVTGDVAALARQIPTVEDRTLLELVNGLTVAQAITADRRELGPAARIVSQILGKDRSGELLTLQALIDGQRALVRWATEICDRGAITNLTVARVADHLRLSVRTAESARAMATELGEMLGARLRTLEESRTRADALSAADHALNASLTAWDAGRTYAALPWPYQALLLARELAAGPCGRLEPLTGDDRYRLRIADGIVARLRADVGERGFAIAEVFDESWQVLRAEQRWLVAEVLDVGLDGSLALPGCPLASVAATTMELAALPGDVRPLSPARSAMSLGRRRQGRIDGSATLPRFVERVVDEQLDAAGTVWDRVGKRSP
jgi:hypothetical protein